MKEARVARNAVTDGERWLHGEISRSSEIRPGVLVDNTRRELKGEKKKQLKRTKLFSVICVQPFNVRFFVLPNKKFLFWSHRKPADERWHSKDNYLSRGLSGSAGRRAVRWNDLGASHRCGRCEFNSNSGWFPLPQTRGKVYPMVVGFLPP